jgi:hypothetical protein
VDLFYYGSGRPKRVNLKVAYNYRAMVEDMLNTPQVRAVASVQTAKASK